jgi:hypothetical protein
MTPSQFYLSRNCTIHNVLHFNVVMLLNINKKFWKELICLLSLHYLKMSFALKPAFAPT